MQCRFFKRNTILLESKIHYNLNSLCPFRVSRVVCGRHRLLCARDNAAAFVENGGKPMTVQRVKLSLTPIH